MQETVNPAEIDTCPEIGDILYHTLDFLADLYFAQNLFPHIAQVLFDQYLPREYDVFPNFIGIFAVQWSGNQHDLWLPDDLTVAEYGWTPDEPTFDYQNCMGRIMAALSRMKDYTDPESYEIDRSCWDGIWLSEDDQWREDIMGLAIPIFGE